MARGRFDVVAVVVLVVLLELFVLVISVRTPFSRRPRGWSVLVIAGWLSG